jgi:CheY-like chemotaxis protein
MAGNLLRNACKFTPAGGRVEVTVGTRDGSCEIAVRDSGAGIDPADLAHIFEPFVQAGRTRSLAGSGLGVGLSLVRELAALHRGSVRASSEGHGRGSEFVIVLPAASPPAVAATDPRAAPGSRSLDILVVEDNEDSAETLVDILQLEGHRAEYVTTARAALSSLETRVPDLIISDIGLPDLSGLELVRLVRQRFGDRIFAIAVSGYAQDEDLVRSRAAGFDAHLAKPPDLERLRALLAGAPRA